MQFSLLDTSQEEYNSTPPPSPTPPISSLSVEENEEENEDESGIGFKRVAQGSNFVFEGSNRTILDLRGLSTDF